MRSAETTCAPARRDRVIDPKAKAWGLQLAREGCRVWRYDSRPAANVDRRVHVRMGGEPTRPAQETRLGTTIGLRTMPTMAARLTGIGRVDIDHRHAGQRGLVGDEGAQLEEGPIVQHSPLAFPNCSLRAFADALQVFQGNPTRSAFRRADKGLRQTVVDVATETPFPAAALPEQPLRALRALLLELAAQADVAGTHLIEVGMLGAGGMVQELAVRGRRQRDDAQVHSQVVARLIWRGFRRVHRDRPQEGVTARALERI